MNPISYVKKKKNAINAKNLLRQLKRTGLKGCSSATIWMINKLKLEKLYGEVKFQTNICAS